MDGPLTKKKQKQKQKQIMAKSVFFFVEEEVSYAR